MAFVKRATSGARNNGRHAASYVEEHGYTLVELTDSGVSAFKNKINATHGRLQPSLGVIESKGKCYLIPFYL